jgi:hypothetical protein
MHRSSDYQTSAASIDVVPCSPQLAQQMQEDTFGSPPEVSQRRQHPHPSQCLVGSLDASTTRQLSLPCLPAADPSPVSVTSHQFLNFDMPLPRTRLPIRPSTASSASSDCNDFSGMPLLPFLPTIKDAPQGAAATTSRLRPHVYSSERQQRHASAPPALPFGF